MSSTCQPFLCSRRVLSGFLQRCWATLIDRCECTDHHCGQLNPFHYCFGEIGWHSLSESFTYVRSQESNQKKALKRRSITALSAKLSTPVHRNKTRCGAQLIVGLCWSDQRDDQWLHIPTLILANLLLELSRCWIIVCICSLLCIQRWFWWNKWILNPSEAISVSFPLS